MARDAFANITAAGTKSALQEAMATAPAVWKNHCQVIPSDGPSERYVWLGALPIPHELIGGRHFDSMADYTFTLANKVYTLETIIRRTDVEDDRHGLINRRIGEIAAAMNTFLDAQLATLLEAGDTSIETFDAGYFYQGSRTIGLSGTIDNSRTLNVDVTTRPTDAEILYALQDCIAAMWNFKDDQGRAGYMSSAMTKLRAIIQPDYDRAFKQAMQSTVIPTFGKDTHLGGSTVYAVAASNPWGQGLVEVDVLPALTPSLVTFYLSAVGDEVKPFIFQQRQDLEIEIYNDAKDIALNDGLMVLCRMRHRFGYGDPRRSCECVLT